MDDPLGLTHVNYIVRGLEVELIEGLKKEETLECFTEFSQSEKDSIEKILVTKGLRIANYKLLNVLQTRPKAFPELIASVYIFQNDALLIKIWDYVRKYFNKRNRPDALQQIELFVNTSIQKHLRHSAKIRDSKTLVQMPRIAPVRPIAYPYPTDLNIYTRKDMHDHLKKYYDVMVLYAKADLDDARKYLLHLRNDIRLKDGTAIKAVLYDGPEISTLAAFIGEDIGVFSRCSYIFLYITKNFVEEIWNETSLAVIYTKLVHKENHSWHIVPVYTMPRQDYDFKIPIGIITLKGLNYFENYKIYQESVISLIEKTVPERIQKNKMSIQMLEEPRQYFPEDLPALERLKMEERHKLKKALWGSITFGPDSETESEPRKANKRKKALWGSKDSFSDSITFGPDFETESEPRKANKTSPSTTTPTTTLPLHLPPDAAHCEECLSILLHDEELDSEDGSDESKSNCQSSSTFKTQWEQKGSSKTMPRDVYESVSFCSLIKASSPEIIRVWEGYRPEEKEHEKQELEHVFVVIVERKIDNLNEKISGKVPHRIIQRLRNEVSEEAKLCLKKEATLDFSLEQHNKMRDTLLRYSGDLMKSHSNLEMVSASKIKSSKGGETTQTEPCILLYVHLKGVIPKNEKAFPKFVGDFPVDVREGVFTNYSDPQLAIGCTIQGEKDLCGKIAGFVHLKAGNIGCLTCSHIFKTSDAMEVDDDNPTSENVYQLSPSLNSTPFGILQPQQCIHKPGFANETGHEIGIDAALIEITERLRNPKDGNYKHSVPPSFACDDTLDFHSGEILTSPEEVAKMYITNKMKCKIVRNNENNNKLYVRTGRINADAASVRLNPWYPQDAQEECQLYVQFHIQPDTTENVDGDDQSFAKKGDSGSLVFLMSENGQHMWAIGMVVGGIQSDGSAIATPIWAVLDAFGLPRNFISFQVTDLADQVKCLNRKVDEMDKKLDVILDTLKNRPGQSNS